MNHRTTAGRRVALGLTAMASLIAQAYAQDATTATATNTPAAAEAPMQTVQVTGYRNSLLSSARDKKESVGFQDSINAEDLGKFPDKNIAESLSRVPGVQVARDVTGEGMTIQIRGLGSSFTKILLNNSPIAVASSGPIDGANTNREVDLDLLPTDLFTKLTVSKSPTAGQIEGGAAGVVNLRSARPFDKEGRQLSMGLTGTKQQIADKAGFRGNVIASNTWDGKFGLLGGISFSRQQNRTSGFETVGWTNPNLTAAQSNSPTRNATGGGNWTIPATVPANAGNGLVAGTAIDQAFLLSRNPGLTIDQIDNAIVPRLGRTMEYYGTRDKISAVLAGEYRPTENLHFYLDTMYSKKDDDMQRNAYTWAVRNNASIPLDMAVDRSDCAAGCVVTKGTFANALNFIEFGPRRDKVDLLGINPGVEWKITPKLTFDAAGNWNRSRFTHEAPTIMPITAPNSGNTITYENNGGVPSIVSNLDLNNPASYQWVGGRVNIQNELRETKTKGFHTNLAWGDKKLTIRGGFAWDDINRRIRAQDNSAAWQAAVCGNNPSVFLQGPNGAPPCDGASTPGASAAALYPGYGTGFTAGQSAPLTYGGSLIPNAALQNYLVPGPYGRLALDWDRFRQDSNFDFFNDNAPDSGASSTGASAGFIREKSKAIYVEANGELKPAGYNLRWNAGVRYVRTEQQVGSLNSVSDPRNASLTLNGSKYPNISQWVYQDTEYSNTLPSGTVALDLTKDVVLRAAASRSMTRVNPNDLRPGINFSGVSADVGTIGNPGLNPYLSDNIDLGIDWFTGREGYLSVTAFQKRLNGFTVNENISMPFSALAQYGINYNTLIPAQQVAIDSRGGPNNATVVMTRPSNADGILRIRGLEIGWVQPLDKILPWRGFGINETLTLINQKASGEGSQGFIALGVPKKTNNFSIYYENYGYMLRLSHTYSQGSQVANANQSGITQAALFGRDYKQADFSSSFELDQIFDREGLPMLTFDVVNINKAKRSGYFQFANATMSQYDPGRTFALGLRMKF
ncbi:TonB-dependent receptor [Pseudoduganella albidiflava]|uniref:TonB-dependent receptor n=1 Tax=Pseudoduganella albidiflava TaxID=321983 RepID=A0A411WVY8_9BURK|nr:TonB-dependent receptor [Pseudoduganella albidiflava]QBI00914.1 TonB-dependent receptor [Pseudoduganella albidiflava]GGY60593.1 TonB-dependent receptor [Pseudoduganella albidiflava]